MDNVDPLDRMRADFWQGEYNIMKRQLAKAEKSLLEAMEYKERIAQLENQLEKEVTLSNARREEIDRLNKMVMDLKKDN